MKDIPSPHFSQAWPKNKDRMGSCGGAWFSPNERRGKQQSKLMGVGAGSLTSPLLRTGTLSDTPNSGQFRLPQPRGRSPGPRTFSFQLVIIAFHQAGFFSPPNHKEP